MRTVVFWLVVTAIAFLIVAAGAVQASGPLCAGVEGTASWYGAESGHRTASEAYFDGSGFTAAMPQLSMMMGWHVRVTDLRTGRSVVVLINDVGPADWTKRVIDLSRAAARVIGMSGVDRVCVEPQP